MLGAVISRRMLMEMALLAQQHAHQTRTTGAAPKLKTLSAEEAAAVEAIAEAIIPADDSPGARQAGVVYFIDQALAGFDSKKRQAYRDGLSEFEAKRREMFPAASNIASLAPAEAAKLLTALEATPFFEMIREHTIAGFLANPEYGGNRNEAGWKLIGFSI